MRSANGMEKTGMKRCRESSQGESNMVKKEIVVRLQDGMEARPVALFVQLAGQFQSQVTVLYKGKKVNAKSIMGMMSLGIGRGEEITAMAEGPDETEALEGIENYLAGKA